jgi:hypothetical protein
MPVFKNIKDHNYSVYLWRVTESLNDLRSDLPEAVNDNIFKNINLHKRKIEKMTQAKLLICAEIDPLLISYDSTGKPYIQNSDKFISFSHSGDYAALMVSHLPCGIDIEKESKKIELISPKFLNENDKCFLSQPGNINWIWSIKEAIFKYFGSRVIFKDDILIDRLNTEQLTARATYRGFYGKGIFELNLDRFEKYYLAYTKAYQPT